MCSGDPLVDLEAALDALAGQDLTSMFGPAVLERTARLLRLHNQLAAQLTRAVREGELTQAAEHDGLTTMQSWLRGHARLSPTAAAQLVRTGRALDQLPAVQAAFTAGAVTAEQVAVIAPVASPRAQAEAVGHGIDLAAVDQLLAQVAATRPCAQLRQVVHHYLARLDPDGPEPDPTEGRRLTIARHADSTRTICGELDPVGGEKLEVWLESYLQADRPAADSRSRAQQLADALVQGVDVALAAGGAPILRTVKPHVAVVINLEDLADPDTSPGTATTGLGTVISAARARWLACDSTISRVVMGPDGRILDHGRDKRIVPAALRRSVEIRDRSCVFAGCGAPASWCDVHHPAAPRGPRRACESWGGGGPSTHQGPPRIPSPPRSLRPMAHPPTRRHRDPHRHTSADLTPGERTTGNQSAASSEQLAHSCWSSYPSGGQGRCSSMET